MQISLFICFVFLFSFVLLWDYNKLSLKSCQPVVCLCMTDGGLVWSGSAFPSRVLIETWIFILGSLWRLTDDPFYINGEERTNGLQGVEQTKYTKNKDEKETGGHKFRCPPIEHEYKWREWWTGRWRKEIEGRAEVITKCLSVELLCCMFSCQSVVDLCQLSWREQTAVLSWVWKRGRRCMSSPEASLPCVMPVCHFKRTNCTVLAEPDIYYCRLHIWNSLWCLLWFVFILIWVWLNAECFQQ